MTTFNELMAATRITVRSPDTGLVASVTSGSRMDITFAPKAFGTYDETRLSEQLAQLLARVVEGREQARRTALARAIDEQVNPRPEWELDAAERRFRAACAQIVAAGQSTHKQVRVRRIGHNDWTVRIKPGCLASLTEERFLAELASAVRTTMAEHHRQVAVARHDIFGATRSTTARVLAGTHIPTHS